MNIAIFFYRLVSGLMGGLFGTLFIFMIYLFSVFFLGNKESPVTSFVLIFMVFLGSLVANLMTGVFLSLADPEKYSRGTSMLWQAFMVNMFLFVVAFPFYILLKDFHLVAFIHFLFSAFVSNILFEFFSYQGSYAITGLYGSLFATFIIFVVLTLLQTLEISSFLLFGILPITWFALCFFTLLVEISYTQLYRSLGVKFLDNTNTF